ncbi:MAG: InlB B-repeat-containing protein [Spirochaetales bacterium]|nr:InlB B-repeat-containing protein [Spirochaetales bacterium]
MKRKVFILIWVACTIASIFFLDCKTEEENDSPSVYSVTYNGNGSTGGEVPVDGNEYEEGQSVTVLGNTGSLALTGHSFTGWNTRSDGLGTTYIQDQTFVMGTEDVVLYAGWTSNPTFTVTYYATDADSGNVPVDGTHYEEGRTVTVLGNTGNLARTGYTFSGWNTLADGDGTFYGQNQTFIMGTQDVMLFAVWVPAYSVSYHAPDADSGIVPVDAGMYVQGSFAEVCANTGNLARDGFLFIGWSETPGSSSADFSAKESLQIGTADVPLYAVWLPFRMIDVTVSAGGISFPTGITDLGTGVVNDSYAIGETEVTWALWDTVRSWASTDSGEGQRADGGTLYIFANTGRMGSEASGTGMSEQHPVTMINWRDAMVFCNALTEFCNVQNMAGLSFVYTTDASYGTPVRICNDDDSISYPGPGGQDDPYVNPEADGFRLPLSMEWELAARWCGIDADGRTDLIDGSSDVDLTDGYFWTPGEYASGALTFYNDEDDINPANSVVDGKDANDMVAVYGFYYNHGWVNKNTIATQEVAGLQANELGIFDMSGNVGEWVFGWFPGQEGLYRMIREGYWHGTAATLRIGMINYFRPHIESADYGFRLCKSAD